MTSSSAASELSSLSIITVQIVLKKYFTKFATLCESTDRFVHSKQDGGHCNAIFVRIQRHASPQAVCR